MTAQPTEALGVLDILDALDNALAHKRILGQVLKFRSKLGIPKAAFEFVRSERAVVDGLAKLELVYFLPVAKKIQPLTAVIGGDFELTINVWAMPLEDHKGIQVVSSHKIVIDDVERCEVHVLAPLKSQAGVAW
jgi:hypothetical protein